ncbi:MAG: hypothetical protein FJZ63_04635 [Chlamydiae bacterium]|nr:hypothetical protein [Chlamydiota bacterium]
MQKRVRMEDTDATGFIYFTSLQKMAVEVLEEFLEKTPYASHKLLLEGAFLLPIGHVEASYLVPIALGDLLEISFQLMKVGNSSFELHYIFYKKEHIVAEITMVHVAIAKETKKSIALPKDFIQLFQKMK